jgi:hypothetical protein
MWCDKWHKLSYKIHACIYTHVWNKWNPKVGTHQPANGQFLSQLNPLHTFLYFFEVLLNKPISVPSTPRVSMWYISFRLLDKNFVSICHAFLGTTCTIRLIFHDCIALTICYHHHGLEHAWSVTSSWTVCWSFHLNCERPRFLLLFGVYVKIFLGIRLSPILGAWHFHVDINFRILLFRLKMFSYFLILVLLIRPFFV